MNNAEQFVERMEDKVIDRVDLILDTDFLDPVQKCVIAEEVRSVIAETAKEILRVGNNSIIKGIDVFIARDMKNKCNDLIKATEV